MGSLQIGRIPADALQNVKAVRLGANRVRYSGRIGVGGDFTLDRLVAIRDQVVALGRNPDEMHVPAVFSTEPRLTEMVHVTDSSVEVGPGEFDERLKLGSEFEIEAERVGSQPNIESLLVGGWRDTTTVSTSLPTPWHAVPAAALDYYDGTSTFQPAATSRITETGNVSWYKHPGFGAGFTGVAVARFAVPEGHWYDGAARIEVQHASGEWHDLIGRHVPPAPDGLTKPRFWRLTNGAVRIYPSATGGTFEVQAYSGGAWGTPKVIEFEAADGIGGYFFNRIHTMAVRRNSPEECKVRLTVGMTAASVDYPHRVTLDLSLRRGDRIVDGRLSMAGQSMLGAVTPNPTEAGTALSGNGGGRTNTAVNSNRFVLLTPATTSFTTGTSSLYSAGSGDRKKAWSFGVGWEIGGSGAGDPERATDLRNQYFAPFAERMLAVGW